MRNLKKWLWSLVLYFSQGKEQGILYFKSQPENKEQFIYFVVIGEHCPDAKKFLKIFPDTMEIPEFVYERMLVKGVTMVLVGDAKDVDSLEPEEPIQETLRVSSEQRN